jgi:WD40 repeat protein
LAFSASGDSLATTDNSTPVILSIPGWKEEHVFSGSVNGVSAVSLSSNETLLASADNGGRFTIWPLTVKESPRIAATIQGQGKTVAFGPGDGILAGHITVRLANMTPAHVCLSGN